jgi:hypothetical protein
VSDHGKPNPKNGDTASLAVAPRKAGAASLEPAGVSLGDLPEAVKRSVCEHAEAIREHMCRGLEQVWHVGARLLCVKELIQGRFHAWLEEQGIEERSARNWMSLASNFPAEIISALPVTPTAAYRLAHVAGAREEAIQMARAGQKVTIAVAERLLQKYRGEVRALTDGSDDKPEGLPISAGAASVPFAPPPKWLECLLKSNAIGMAHVEQLLGLVDVFGADLTASFVCGVREDDHKPGTGAAPLTPPDAQSFVYACSVESMPPVLARQNLAGDPPGPVVEAANEFLRKLDESEGHTPQWEVAAFWWACQVVLARLTPDELAAEIRDWQVRFEDAVTYWTLHGGTAPDPEWDKASKGVWCAYQDDLWQAGVLGEDESLTLDRSCQVRAVRRSLGRGRYWLPSPFLWKCVDAEGVPMPEGPAHPGS